MGCTENCTVPEFIPRAVMMDFFNALAILIFSAQIQYIFSMSIMTYILVLAILAIVYLFPYLTKAVPATLVAILFLTAVVLFFLESTSKMSEILVRFHKLYLRS